MFKKFTFIFQKISFFFLLINQMQNKHNTKQSYVCCIFCHVPVQDNVTIGYYITINRSVPVAIHNDQVILICLQKKFLPKQ